METVTVEGRQARRYTYDADDGTVVRLQAHPTEAFEWMVGGDGRHAEVIEAFVAAGLSRGERPFLEAIATLDA